MNKAELFHYPDIIVWPENLSDWRQEIAGLREEKGKELQTLRLIHRVLPFVKAYGEHEHVVHLHFEEVLVWQHVFMVERDRETGPNVVRQQRAQEMMKKAVNRAEREIQDHGIDNLKTDLYRFAGRVDDYRGEYQSAKNSYEFSLRWFKKSDYYKNNPAKRFELEGYLAADLIRTGLTREGLRMAARTYIGLLESQEGRELERKDYYTWAVWMSGVAIHTSRALIESNLGRQHKDKIEEWMDNAESLLIVPEGVTIWTEARYELRKDEIEAIRRDLA